MTLVMLLGNLNATRHNNQCCNRTIYQKPTHVSHAALHAVQSFYIIHLLYTAYSSHLRIIGWAGQQNKTKINKRKNKVDDLDSLHGL